VSNTSNEIRQRVLAAVSQLREALQELRGETQSGAACDAIEEAVAQLADHDAKLLRALETEVSRRAHAEEFRRFAYEESPFSMAIAALEDGRFIEINDAFLVRTGYTRDEVIGRTSDELGLWPPGEGRGNFVEILRRDGEVHGLELRVNVKDGGTIHVRFFARLIILGGKRCILSITQNIEERHLAEQEAIRLRAFYEELLALLPAHIVIVDREGRYEYFSPAALPDPELREWAIGRTILEVGSVRGFDSTFVNQRKQWVDLVAERREVMQFDERIVQDSGDVEHWIRTHKPILDERGEVARILIYSLNVTDLRHLEEQFRQAQKMEAVGRLAGGVAHDFNNLLTAIMGTADLLTTHAEDPAAVKEGALEILHIAERGAALTRQLLAFSRRQVVNRTPLNLNRVIEAMHEMVRRLIGENIELNLDLAPSLPDISADANQLEQVILNLVVNARDAMPRGGALTIRTRGADGRLREGRGSAENAAPLQVILTVSDTGNGMPPDVMARAFEPFFTTKEAGKGTGLGLSTLYAIVQGYNGTVAVESSEGQGTIFTIGLPAAAAIDRVVVAPPPSIGRPSGTGTVLVVEDEDAVRRVVERILVKEGYTVLTARNAHEAMRVVEENEAAIGLVLTDMVMPGPSGRDLAERLLEKNPELRILFMSGHIDNRDSRFIAEKLGDRFIQKPFTAEVLTARVSKILGEP
jgi:PAS domain S-box-containing protein